MKTFLIPARSGSKTILDKNLVDLGGHPLMRWTIEAAKEVAASMPDASIFVTSDDTKILDVAEACGALAHKRPARLADDHATMRDVVRDFFKARAECSEVVLLYPTSPFRSAATIRRAIDVFDDGSLAGRHRSLMGAAEHRGRPFGGLQIVNGRFAYAPEAEAYYRKQDTPALYFANGAIYIIAREELDQLNTQLFNATTSPFVMYGMENLDIDTPHDLEQARAWEHYLGAASPARRWPSLTGAACA